jgi:hypothetical protein
MSDSAMYSMRTSSPYWLATRQLHTETSGRQYDQNARCKSPWENWQGCYYTSPIRLRYMTFILKYKDKLFFDVVCGL